MSELALQHVVVRMLYDRGFADSVFDSPRRALAGVDLSEQEIAWILRTDRRAFRTDPHRRARSLTGLLEEYPTASASLVRLARRDPPVAVLDEFFSSEEFHGGMQAGRSLAISFGEFLLRAAVQTASGTASSSRGAPHAPSRGGGGNRGIPESPDAAIAIGLATIELAIARLRRLRLLAAPAVVPEPDLSSMGAVRTAPTCAWVEVHPDTLDRFGEIRRRIALSEIDARAAVVDLAIDLGTACTGTSARSGPGDGSETSARSGPDAGSEASARSGPDDGSEASARSGPGDDSEAGPRSEPILLSAKVEPNPAPGGWMRVIDVELSPISEELASVLDAARLGIAIPALLDRIRSLGADDSESREIVKDLVRDGLLIESV